MFIDFYDTHRSFLQVVFTKHAVFLFLIGLCLKIHIEIITLNDGLNNKVKLTFRCLKFLIIFIELIFEMFFTLS